MSVLCSSVLYYLLSSGKIRKYLDKGETQPAIHVLVTSRFDNLNSLLYGLPASWTECNLCKTLPPALCPVPPLGMITSPRCSAPYTWLPIRYRVQFKTLTMIYKAMHGEGPYNPRRSLRSGCQQLLYVPKTRTPAGDRAFSVAASTLWNDFPLTLRQAPSSEAFKRHFKKA